MALDGKLRWLCRRGTRELDVLLASTSSRWDEMFTNAQEKHALMEILHMQDPELYDLLTGRVQSSNPVIDRVCHKLSPHLQDHLK